MNLSTTEADYVALGDPVKEILFLGTPGKGMPCFSVFEENQGVQLVQNPVTNSNSRRIDVLIILQ